MPVDETILETTLADLHTKYRASRDVTSVIEKILTAAQGISKVEDPADRQGPRLMPDDPILGGELAAVRRQAIYDKVIADHAAL